MIDPEFITMIATAKKPAEFDYEGEGNWLARQFLEFMKKSEPNRSLSMSDTYDACKHEGRFTGNEGYTGFMVGWAFNAARHILGLDGEPNPALLIIDTEKLERRR